MLWIFTYCMYVHLFFHVITHDIVHVQCMYQMFICLYWNYKVKIIAFIGKKSEIKKNDQTKKKKKNLERQDLCEIRIINTCTGTRKSLKTTIGCQYKLKDIYV